MTAVVKLTYKEENGIISLIVDDVHYESIYYTPVLREWPEGISELPITIGNGEVSVIAPTGVYVVYRKTNQPIKKSTAINCAGHAKTASVIIDGKTVRVETCGESIVNAESGNIIIKYGACVLTVVLEN